MTSIFIVAGSSGCYSDHSEWNVCAVHSEDRAKAIVDMLNAAAKYDLEFGDSQYKNQPQWCLDNPEPKFLHGKTNRQKENIRPDAMKKLRADHDMVYKAWCHNYEAARQAFTENNYKQPAATIKLMKKFDIKPGTIHDVDYEYSDLMIEDESREYE